MIPYKVVNSDLALAYIVDCQLATVADLAMKKSKGVNDFKRHILIAQRGVDWVVQFSINYSDTRIKDIVDDYGGSVLRWAEHYNVKTFS